MTATKRQPWAVEITFYPNNGGADIEVRLRSVIDKEVHSHMYMLHFFETLEEADRQAVLWRAYTNTLPMPTN